MKWPAGFRFLFATLMLAFFLGCNGQENPQEIREKAAKATENAKRDAKAVAEGIRDGWNRDRTVNLNSASKSELLALPGMTSAEADRVIAGRPYKKPAEIVTKRIVSRDEYDRISDRLTAGG